MDSMEQVPENPCSEAVTIILISDEDDEGVEISPTIYIFEEDSNLDAGAHDDDAQDGDFHYGYGYDREANDGDVHDGDIQDGEAHDGYGWDGLNVVWVRNSSTQTEDNDFLECNFSEEEINNLLQLVGIILAEYDNLEIQNVIRLLLLLLFSSNIKFFQ